jgi:hypothetical protein
MFGCSISDYRCEVEDKFILLSCYRASSGNFLPTFREKLVVPSLGVKNPNRFGFVTHEDVVDRLPRKVHKKLTLLAA